MIPPVPRSISAAGRRGAGRRGFTMVEVLVSMVLMAAILPVAMQGISLALHAAAFARQKSVAASLAQTQMDDIIDSASWNQSNLGGDFPDNPGYSWTAQVTEWSGTTVQQLEVTVQWMAQNQQRSVTLDTLVYTGPATSGGNSSSTASGSTSP